jgi:hypothetical protein
MTMPLNKAPMVDAVSMFGQVLWLFDFVLGHFGTAVIHIHEA